MNLKKFKRGIKILLRSLSKQLNEPKGSESFNPRMFDGGIKILETGEDDALIREVFIPIHHVSIEKTKIGQQFHAHGMLDGMPYEAYAHKPHGGTYVIFKFHYEKSEYTRTVNLVSLVSTKGFIFERNLTHLKVVLPSL